MSTVAEATATVETHRLLFPGAVHQVSTKAQAALPVAMQGRVQRATALVLEHGVFIEEDGSVTHVRSSKGHGWYAVNGHCVCADASRADEGLCKHRLAKAIYRRASELMLSPLPTVGE